MSGDAFKYIIDRLGSKLSDGLLSTHHFFLNVSLRANGCLRKVVFAQQSRQKMIPKHVLRKLLFYVVYLENDDY
jgi:hypothetical protein